MTALPRDSYYPPSLEVLEGGANPTNTRRPMDDDRPARDIEEGGWAWVQHEIINEYGPQLGAYGIAIYVVLASQVQRKDHAIAKASLRFIERAIGTSRPTVVKFLGKLESLGLIVKTGSEGETNCYTLLDARGGGKRHLPPPAPSGKRDLPGVVNEIDQGGKRGLPKQEVEKDKKAAAEQPTPQPAILEHDEPPAAATAVELFTRAFNVPGNPAIRAALKRADIQDLELWQQVLVFWASNPKWGVNVAKIVDRYQQCLKGGKPLEQVRQANGLQDFPAHTYANGNGHKPAPARQVDSQNIAVPGAGSLRKVTSKRQP